MNDGWTKEIPKENGTYWFYGWIYGTKKLPNGKPRDPTVELVDVIKVSNGFLFSVGGSVIDERKALGKWMRRVRPPLPTLEDI